MKITVETIYQKGVGVKNEDCIIVNESANIFGVIDGATGLGGLSGDLAANIIGDILKEVDGEQDILEAVKIANKTLAKEIILRTSYRSIDEIPKEFRSTCGLVLIRIVQGKFIEYVQVGDCMLFLEYKNKHIRNITFDRVAILDHSSTTIKYQEMKMFLNEHSIENPNELPVEKLEELNNELKERIKDILIKNRRLLNTPLGYGILDGSKEAESELEYGCVPISNVSKILLITDGLQIPVTMKKADNWLQSAQLAFNGDLNSLHTEVSRIEEEDPACYLYPRLKKSDDKAGILITIC